MQPQRRALIVTAIVVLAGCGLGAGLLVRASLASPDRAVAGDCLADDDGSAVPYRKADCADRAARYSVLTAADAEGNPCVDVPGASRLARLDGKVLCIGRKGADAARAANVAKAGECLRIGRNVEAERLPCADRQANVKVLQRLTNVQVGGPAAFAEDPCAKVPGTAIRFSYDWRSDPPAKPVAPSLGTTAELLFCLARATEPPPAVPGAKADCRYATGKAVLAAANASNRSPQTDVYAQATPLGCMYHLSTGPGRGGDDIHVKLAPPDPSWPPINQPEFDVDGAKAAWRDGSDGRGGTLSVDRPTARLDIVVGTTYENPRDTAVAVYRAAARHVP